MRIVGEWEACDDGETRPVIEVRVARADGSFAHDLFLIDTGADRTVLGAALEMRSCCWRRDIGIASSMSKRLAHYGEA